MRRAILLSIVLTHVLSAEVREWTDVDGRKIKAEIVRVDAENLVIRRQGKLYTWPLSKFSAADQTFATDWQTKRDASRKQRLANLTGAFPNKPLTTRAYTKPAEYLAGDLFQDYLQRTPPDYRQRNGKALEYDITKQSAALFVPPNYDESQAFGVYVFVPAGSSRLPPADYQALFEKHQLIFIAADGSGNKEELSRRLALALDCLATVKAAYRVDPNRCYVGGVSGGGIMSTMINFLRPEHFRAAMNIARGALLESHTMETTVSFGSNSYQAGATYSPFLPRLENKHAKVSRDYKNKRWVFISGDRDFNYEFSQASGNHWTKHGYTAKFFDVPGMGHANAPVASFEEALNWIENDS